MSGTESLQGARAELGNAVPILRVADLLARPTHYWWAYEMQVEDLDGNVRRMESEPKSDRPFGEWLDARGGRWARTPAGR